TFRRRSRRRWPGASRRPARRERPPRQSGRREKVSGPFLQKAPETFSLSILLFRAHIFPIPAQAASISARLILFPIRTNSSQREKFGARGKNWSDIADNTYILPCSSMITYACPPCTSPRGNSLVCSTFPYP